MLFAATANAKTAPAPVPLLSYADFADLSDNAPTILRAQVRSVAVVEPARAPGVRPGWARLYVEARTVALLTGAPLTGDSLRYQADVPLDPKGKVPRLIKREVILFARTVPARPGELQLVAPDAQVLWSPEGEARLRGVLDELLGAGAPGRLRGVQEAIFVPGNLVGEGETQMFLAMANGEPASISVVHAPNQPRRWSVSFSEVVDSTGAPPRADTLAWYRLACFLPRRLDPAVNVSATGEDKAQAGADYAWVLEQLGPCTRTRG
ncbi:hypothetical protein [Novosphingobium flavum]|uniref:hypothetical protein n=1 Tax=Novosphingobium flavum TaxID=1778672 RepID=UPI0031B58468